MELAPPSLPLRYTERSAVEILDERRKLVSKMRFWVLLGAVVGALLLIP